jgi:hypothetical protein
MAQVQVGSESLQLFQVAAGENEVVMMRGKFRRQGTADAGIRPQDQYGRHNDTTSLLLTIADCRWTIVN